MALVRITPFLAGRMYEAFMRGDSFKEIGSRWHVAQIRVENAVRVYSRARRTRRAAR